MDLGISGRHVLITGGSKGIGLACAKAFLDEGARVTIVSRNRENLDKAAAILGKVGLVAADLANADDAARAVAEAEDAGGPVDILVNSAGSARRTPAEELSPDHYRAAMDAKFFSYVNVIDPVIKRMAARGSGAIVNVIGNGGKVASPIHIAGGAANAALMLATAGLANAYAAHGIRVLAVNPGLTETERVAEGLEADAKAQGISVEEARRRGVSKIALGRYARPEEIADAVVFLASGRASYISGVSITMDGVAVPTII
ncbi:MAG: SDR family oxidoreductase [Rhizobiaceae bacterium]|nr:SDR family oxidoreductase [Rhizobiaceae bacterium]